MQHHRGAEMAFNKIKKIRVFLFLTALLVVVPALVAWAARIAPAQVQISTPVYTPGENFKPVSGLYSYTVSWNGIPAGSVELELNLNGSVYEIRASARSAKVIDLLYKVRYDSETLLAADTLRPKYSISVSKANSRKKITEMVFLPDGEIHSVRKDHRGRVKTLDFESTNFTLEPYSAGFLALSQDWKVGDVRQFDLFSGKSRYLIEFTAVEQTELKVNDKMRPAIVLTPMIKNLTDSADDDKQKKKLRQAQIYISMDHPREILKITSDLLFGSVDTEMVAFAPKNENSKI